MENLVGSMASRRILITAGPTVEDIDPVRFISNRSTGRMGVALAVAAIGRGAQVDLVHGPLLVALPQLSRLAACAVRGAQEMRDRVMEKISGVDAAIMCAAVADFTPASPARQKIKKEAGGLDRIDLVRTPDILAEAGRLPKRPFLVGFAAETHDLAKNAQAKLERKNCDLLCANDLTEPGSGFGTETNRIVIFRRNAESVELPLLSKNEVAERILDEISQGW